MRVKLDDSGEVENFELVTAKSDVRENGTLKEFSYTIDASKRDQVPAMIERFLEREEKRVGRKLRVELTTTETVRENPKVTFPANISLDAHRRGFLKIAYELGCSWLGPEYVDDPAAAQLRDAVLSLAADPPRIPGTMSLVSGDHAWDRLWPSEGHRHLAFTARSGGTISLVLRVLGVLHGVVKLTDDASRYGAYEDMFLTMDPRVGTRRLQSFRQELEMWASIPNYPLRGQFFGWAYGDK